MVVAARVKTSAYYSLMVLILFWANARFVVGAFNLIEFIMGDQSKEPDQVNTAPWFIALVYGLIFCGYGPFCWERTDGALQEIGVEFGLVPATDQYPRAPVAALVSFVLVMGFCVTQVALMEEYPPVFLIGRSLPVSILGSLGAAFPAFATVFPILVRSKKDTRCFAHKLFDWIFGLLLFGVISTYSSVSATHKLFAHRVPVIGILGYLLGLLFSSPGVLLGYESFKKTEALILARRRNGHTYLRILTDVLNLVRRNVLAILMVTLNVIPIVGNVMVTTQNDFKNIRGVFELMMFVNVLTVLISNYPPRALPAMARVDQVGRFLQGLRRSYFRLGDESSDVGVASPSPRVALPVAGAEGVAGVPLVVQTVGVSV